MDRIATLIGRAEQLFSKRSALLAFWQDVAENFYVERADFTLGRSIGQDMAAHLNSSYPLIVRRELGDAFSAMLRPRDIEWFSMTIEREERLDNAGRVWLERASNIQRRAMYDRQSQFVRATKEGDHDFATFGQAILTHELNHRAQTLLYRCWHPRDVAWCERFDGTIGEVFRNWSPTITTLASYFGKEKLHPKLLRALEKEPYREVRCLHARLYSEDYAETPSGKTWRTPYVSIYIDVENRHVLEEIGVNNRIYTIPRWQTVSGSQYAFSPAVVAALPEARMLQAMSLTLLEAGEMAVRPPLIATKDAIRSDVQVFAGGITWADAEYDERLGEVLRPVYQDKGGMPLGMDLQEASRNLLGSAFYINKLTLPPAADGQMTAYETGQRIQEYIRSAVPLFEPMELEYNGSLCEETFDLLMRVGTFGPLDEVPQSLSEAQVRFQFESPLHEAIERKKGQTFLEAKELIRQAIELDPSTVATMDARKALRDALNGVNTPAAWLRSESDVEAYAKDQAAQQQAEALAQQVQGGAAAAEAIGSANKSLQTG